MQLAIGSCVATGLAVLCVLMFGIQDAEAKKHIAAKTEKVAPLPTPAAPVPIPAVSGDAPKGRVVLDVTPIPAMTGGGPVLAIDPGHSKTLLQLTVMAPAAETNAVRAAKLLTMCRESVSLDGGFTWNFQRNLPIKPAADCRSPALAVAADGSFYAAARARTLSGHPNAGYGIEIDLVESDDAGRSWSTPVRPFADTDAVALRARGFGPPRDPSDLFDHPRLQLDGSRGLLYVSAGGHPQRYIAGTSDAGGNWSLPESPDCDENGGGHVECWQYPATADAALGAANGVLAALYSSGPPLRKTAPRQGSCDQLCWIFATSIDGGQHWRRLRLPKRLVGSASGDDPSAGFVAADPNHRGAFAIMLFRPQQASLQLATTTNFGASWSSSYVLNEDPAARVMGRPAIAYSPDGIIGVAWRGSDRAKNPKKLSLGSAQDMYGAISRDGGRSFSAPSRVNAGRPPEDRSWPDAAPSGGDTPPSLTIDAQYLYAAWDQYDDGQPHNLSHGWFARIPLREFVDR